MANIDSHTDASLGSGANITAGTGAGDTVSIQSGLIDNSDGTAFAGQAGLVSVVPQVAVLNDSSSQSSHVDNGGQIRQVGGTLDVGSHETRNDSSFAAGGGIGAVAAGAAIAVANVGGSTNASIGSANIGQTAGKSVGGVHVWVDPNTSVTAFTLGIQAGLGAALSGTVSLATLNPTITATVGPNALIKVSNDVNVSSTPQTSVDAEAYGVSVGAIALGASVAIGCDNPTITTSLQAAQLNAGHDIIVQTVYNQNGGTGTTTNVEAGSGGIFAGVGAYGGADCSATITTSLTGVNVGSITAGDAITVSSNVTETANANVLALAVGLVGIARASPARPRKAPTSSLPAARAYT